MNELIYLQGPLAWIRDVVGGHQSIVDKVQCLQYELDFENEDSLLSAKQKLHHAFCNITEPLRVKGTF